MTEFIFEQNTPSSRYFLWLPQICSWNYAIVFVICDGIMMLANFDKNVVASKHLTIGKMHPADSRCKMQDTRWKLAAFASSCLIIVVVVAAATWMHKLQQLKLKLLNWLQSAAGAQRRGCGWGWQGAAAATWSCQICSSQIIYQINMRIFCIISGWAKYNFFFLLFIYKFIYG